MKHLQRLTLVIFVHFFASTLLLPLLPELERTLEIPRSHSLFLEASFWVAHVVSLLVLGHLADRFGHRRLILAATLLQAGGFLILALVPTYESVILSRLLSGAGSGILPLALGWIHLHTRERSRGMFMAVMAVTLGAALGPLLGGGVGTHQLWLVGILGGLTSLIGALWSRGLSSTPALSNEAEPTSTPGAQINFRLITASLFFVALSFYALRTQLPFILSDISFGTQTIGLVFFISLLLMGILQFGFANVSWRRVSQKTAYALGVLVMLSGILLIRPATGIGIFGGFLIFTVGIALADPLSVILLTRYAPRKNFNKKIATSMAIASTARVIAPLGLMLVAAWPQSEIIPLIAVPSVVGVGLIFFIKSRNDLSVPSVGPPKYFEKVI